MKLFTSILVFITATILLFGVLITKSDINVLQALLISGIIIDLYYISIIEYYAFRDEKRKRKIKFLCVKVRYITKMYDRYHGDCDKASYMFYARYENTYNNTNIFVDTINRIWEGDMIINQVLENIEN